MKKKLLISLSLLSVAAVSFLISQRFNGKEYYQPRESAANQEYAPQMIGEAMKFYAQMRANQITGKVDPEDVELVRAQIASLEGKLHKSSLPLLWKESGPDNVGGRTRAFLIDKDNNQVLYQGAVSGGLWKSENGGNSWYKINDAQENLAVISITQAIDGAIYYGTGEGAIPFNDANGTEGTFIEGEGVYKSTDGGKTFTMLNSTRNWKSTLSMGSDPKNNVIYAGNEIGFHFSTDGGNTWTRVANIGGGVTCITVDPEGVVLVNRGGFIYRSETPTNAGSYTATLTEPGFNRMEMAFAHSDRNYVYAGASRTDNFWGGLYRSTDNGKTWEKIHPGRTEFFTPLSSDLSAQGGYDLCIGVDPSNKNRVFIGGVDFAEWTPEKGAYEVASLFQSPTNPFYIHADKHRITFDTRSNPPIMYVSTDGGTFKTTDASLSRYREINNGYATIQYYGVAGAADGSVLAGSQDNGTHYINKKGSTPLAAVEVLGGDGFRTAISQYNNDIFFMETYFGGIWRSANRGRNNSQFFNASSRIPTRARGASTFDLESDFNTAFKLWERNKDESRFFVSVPTGIWMATNPTNFVNPPEWFRIANRNRTYHYIEASKDGDHVFACRSGEVIRISGLNKAIFTTEALPVANQVSDSLTVVDITSNLPRGRFITDVEVDPNDPNRLIVTFGNYGNNTYIYYTDNALDPAPTWRSIQGNLPFFPVYCAEFSEANGQSNTIILGTEFGIYSTSNVTVSSPSWIEQNNAVDITGKTAVFPRVPVYELVQVRENMTGPSEIILYAGTHGRGVWETGWRLSSIRETSAKAKVLLNAYPNPASGGELNMTFTTAQNDEILVRMADLTGKVVYTTKIRASAGVESKLRIPVNNLSSGTYLVSLEGARYKSSSKVMVMN